MAPVDPDHTAGTISDAQVDRAQAALLGVALGDALGMPTQTLSSEEILQHYGTVISFVAPFPNHPVSHGLQAAMVTDDTQQTLLLADRLIHNPHRFDPMAWANDLLDWEAGIKALGLHDLLGPSTKLALQNLLAGMPVSEAGKEGTTNGASMRIAPVGIAMPVEPLQAFLDYVQEPCLVTHNTAEAIAASAAVAAVVSAGVDGADFEEALPLAIAAAKAGSSRGHPKGEINMASRIRYALDFADKRAGAGSSVDGFVREFAATVGTSVSSYESVSAAFGIVRLAEGDPWRAGVIAANIGDDTDTIGSIAMGMAAACSGLVSLPEEQVRRVIERNDLEVSGRVDELLKLRRQRADQSCQHRQNDSTGLEAQAP